MRFTPGGVLRSLTILSAAFLLSQASMAQGGPNVSLGDQLRSHYKITKMGMDSSGVRVAEGGTVLVVQKGGILGVPPANPIMATATYRDGDLHPPGAGSRMFIGNDTRLFDVGERVYVSKIDVNVKNEKVSFTIVECDSCNGLNQPSSYHSVVAFQFQKGYLETAQANQVMDVINKVLPMDADSGGAQGQDQQGQDQQGQDQQGQQGAQDQQQPQTIQIGQSINDVVSILGRPEKTVNLGAKQIYVYKDLKITFLNGQVTDVK
ncbi:MAG: hypothetical protein ACRD5M_14555 [Candidatus Acidiferrales bacterium]